MTEQGIVVEVRGHTATIAAKPHRECAHCCAGSMCRLGGEGGLRHFELENAAQAQVGDLVEVHFPTPKVFLSALLVYIVPLIMLVAGYVIGQGLSGSEEVGMVAGVLALVAAYMGLRVVDRRLARAAGWHPVMGRVVERAED